MIELSAIAHIADEKSSSIIKSASTSSKGLEESLAQFCDDARAASQPEEENEPPKKKRRIIKDKDSLRNPDGDAQYVTLSDVNITLSSGTPFRQRKGVAEEINVHVFYYKRNHNAHTATFSLYGPPGTTTSRDLILKDPSEEVHKHVHWASVLSERIKQVSLVASSECVLRSAPASSNPFSLQIKIKWKVGIAAVTSSKAKATRMLDSLLATYLPYAAPSPFTPWSPRDFYESVHVPNADVQIPVNDVLRGLTTQLYPFQERAVGWLLGREGVRIGDDGKMTQATPDVESSFRPVVDAMGLKCCVSHITGEIAFGSVPPATELHGGILAEEMGLGKTVELIALILLHKREVLKLSTTTIVDPYTGVSVTPSSATLIITPSTILDQWMKEIERHAPSLKVMIYQGVKNSELSDEELKTTLLNHDVVLTTYGVLRTEIHYARENPERNFRNGKKHAPRRTPLVQISWWRVCLDEAQMVESGVSNAAQVARLIPRHNAWAVTGTPLKKDVKDLLGLLVFLRYSPYCHAEYWDRLIHNHKDIFVNLFGLIAMRHTKAAVRGELHLPAQKRLVITVPFTAIEEQNYSHLFQQMCDDCGLDAAGGPLREEWDPTSASTIEKMRSWLTRLRQTCLHAEIGVRNRRALGRGNGPLRTVEEVLEVLIEQNETLLRAEERVVLTSKVTQGHVLSFGKERHGALKLYLSALEEATGTVSECREQLIREQQMVEKNNVAILANGVKEADDTKSDVEDENVEEITGKLNVAKLRLRATLEMQHVCAFFAATAYFQLKESLATTDADSETIQDLEKKESKAYEQAKTIRKELLTEVSHKTTQLIAKVSTLRSKPLDEMPPVEIDGDVRGIESRKIFDAIEDLAEILNGQAKDLQDTRMKLGKLLTVGLLDQDEDLEMTGDEYETSTKQQEEQYALHEALRAAHADRYGIITGQVNLLINHEMSQALYLAINGKVHAPEEKGPAPELMIAMLGKREQMVQKLRELSKRNNLPPEAQISVRGIIAEVRSMVTSLQWQESGRSNRAAVEAGILERELHNLQSISTQQIKALANLEKEIDLYRSTMNQRLEFYRQLQQISDTVAPLQEEENSEVDTKRLKEEERKEATHTEKLATFRTKKRFLNHLRAESSGTDEQRICVICQSTFEIGVLTVCGHQYCKECINLWWNSKGTCPTCKRPLKQRDFHEITYKPQALQVVQEESTLSTNANTSNTISSSPNTRTPATAPASIYTPLPTTTLASIQSLSLRNNASYGTKIDTLARHLLYLRTQDPGSKSIIFSQYADFLSILATAFTTFGIGHISIAAKNGIQQFREDPSKECFFMHAKADSSGLNLVNATHVFLCEPVINTALELQAIARVHRIGQRRPTTVWMYLVSDTVEEAIYDISVSRRLAHMQQKSKTATAASTSLPTSRDPTPGIQEQNFDAANSFALQTAPISKLLTSGQSGGEVVEATDLWNCLFGGSAASNRRRGGNGGGGLGVGVDLGDEGNREVERFLRVEAAEGRR